MFRVVRGRRSAHTGLSRPCRWIQRLLRKSVKLISSCWAPSDLYTSIIPALLVDGVSEAIRGANGKCAFVMNLTTKTGETEGYPASCFCKAIEEELGQGRINAVIMNNEAPTDELIHEYVEISRTPLVVDDLMARLTGLSARHFSPKGWRLRHWRTSWSAGCLGMILTNSRRLPFFALETPDVLLGKTAHYEPSFHLLVNFA